MKRSIQIAVAICIASIIGCGGNSDSANSNNGGSNVTDQIANRTNIDDDQRRDTRADRGTEPQANRGMAGSDTRGNDAPTAAQDTSAANLNPSAFDSAMFPDANSVATDDDSEAESDVEAEPESGGSAFGLVDAGEGRGPEPDRGSPAPQPDIAGNQNDDEVDGEDEDVDASESESAEVEQPLSLLAEAKRRFLNHEEEQGIDLLYAHHLVSDEARSNYSLSWFKGLKEPRLLLRLGVGVVYNAPKDFDGRQPVIGDPGDPNEGASSDRGSRGRSGGRNSPGPVGIGGGGGGRSRGSRVYKNIDTSRPDGFLLYYTGEFGEAVVRELDKRRTGSDAAYGQMLKDVMEVELPKEEEDEQQASNRGRNRGGNAGAAASISGLGGGTGRGRANDDDDEEEDTSVLDTALGRNTAEKPDDLGFSGSIRPGVLLLGVGSKKELLERAKTANVDSLITFNVKITSPRRGGTPTNTTSVKFLDLKGDNEQLFSSRSLKDTTVKEKQDDGDKPVEKEVERLFGMMDENFAAAPLPSAINEDNVKKRVGRLLQTHADNPLPAAVEVVAYFEKKLITEELAKTAMSRLFKSDDAHVLIVGDSSERLGFLSKWLPDGIVN